MRRVRDAYVEHTCVENLGLQGPLSRVAEALSLVHLQLHKTHEPGGESEGPSSAAACCSASTSALWQ